MLCCWERNEQSASRIMSDYNIDLGEWGVSSVPALMAKIVGLGRYTGELIGGLDLSPASILNPPVSVRVVGKGAHLREGAITFTW